MHCVCGRFMLMQATVVQILGHKRTYEHCQKAVCDEPDESLLRHSAKVRPLVRAFDELPSDEPNTPHSDLQKVHQDRIATKALL